MNIAIFEDDRKFADKLESIIRQHTHFPTIANTSSEAELWKSVDRAVGPVLYFLDIILDGEPRGLEISKRIAEKADGSLIVFCTAYPQKIEHNPYFKTHSFSQIIKSNPDLVDEIKETIILADKVLMGNCFLIHVDKFQVLYIPYDEINYIEAIKHTHKLCLHCKHGQYIIRGTLKAMLEKLKDQGFIQCHKSIIANSSKICIERWDTSNKLIIFRNGTSCPYSFRLKGVIGS